MGLNISVLDFRCFNQLRNGVNFDQNLSDFTPNLVGNIGERVKVRFETLLSWNSFADAVTEWFLTPNQIQNLSGDFLNDGLSAGDVIEFYADWAQRFETAPEFTAEVESVSTDGKIMRFTVLSGTQTTLGTVTNVGFFVDPFDFSENEHTAVFLKFGLIGGEERFNINSKVTNAQQIYYVGGLNKSATESLPMGSLGKIKDWVTGSAKCRLDDTRPNDSFAARYIFEHEFIINPFYILEYRPFFEKGTIPPLLAGANTLKYSVELEFRKTLTDISTSKEVIFDRINGVVGWFGENFNGFNPEYAISNVQFFDNITNEELTGININGENKVLINIERIDGQNIGDYSISAHISALPLSREDYQGTETGLVENFLYDSVAINNPSGVVSATGSIISRLEVRPSGNGVLAELIISYTAEQKQKINTENEYLIWLQLEDSGGLSGNSNRVGLIADLSNYADLSNVDQFVSYRELGAIGANGNALDTPNVRIDTANEDNVALRGDLGVDLGRNAFINTVSFALKAVNPTTQDEFLIEQVDLDISGSVVKNGIQQLQSSQSRGYELPADSIFNTVSIATADKVGDIQYYTVNFGQKVKWQDWIANPNVSELFYDATKPNNNQNFQSSNYSPEQGYEIRLVTLIGVTGIDDLGRSVTGIAENNSTTLSVADYDESDNYTGIIETFDAESMTPLGGAVLTGGKDTLMKATYNRIAGNLAVGYAVHRIQASQAQGDGIFELDTSGVTVDTNPLVPVSGETRLKLTDGGAVIETECLIRGNRLAEGVVYKLSSAIKEETPDVLLQFSKKSNSGLAVSSTGTAFFEFSNETAFLLGFDRLDITEISAPGDVFDSIIDLSSSEWDNLRKINFNDALNTDIVFGEWINNDNVVINAENMYFNELRLDAILKAILQINGASTNTGRILNLGNIIVDPEEFFDIANNIADLESKGWDVRVVNEKVLEFTVSGPVKSGVISRVSSTSGSAILVSNNSTKVADTDTLFVGNTYELFHSSVNDIETINFNSLKISDLEFTEIGANSGLSISLVDNADLQLDRIIASLDDSFLSGNLGVWMMDSSYFSESQGIDRATIHQSLRGKGIDIAYPMLFNSQVPVTKSTRTDRVPTPEIFFLDDAFSQPIPIANGFNAFKNNRSINLAFNDNWQEKGNGVIDGSWVTNVGEVRTITHSVYNPFAVLGVRISRFCDVVEFSGYSNLPAVASVDRERFFFAELPYQTTKEGQNSIISLLPNSSQLRLDDFRVETDVSLLNGTNLKVLSLDQMAAPSGLPDFLASDITQTLEVIIATGGNKSEGRDVIIDSFPELQRIQCAQTTKSYTIRNCVKLTDIIFSDRFRKEEFEATNCPELRRMSGYCGYQEAVSNSVVNLTGCPRIEVNNLLIGYRQILRRAANYLAMNFDAAIYSTVTDWTTNCIYTENSGSRSLIDFSLFSNIQTLDIMQGYGRTLWNVSLADQKAVLASLAGSPTTQTDKVAVINKNKSYSDGFADTDLIDNFISPLNALGWDVTYVNQGGNVVISPRL